MAHGKHKPKQEEESGEGAPLWIISFADMMSLLMAFFVMLSTFSGFGSSEAQKLRKAVKAAIAPNFYGGWHAQRHQAATGPQVVAAGQLEAGSEKPTIDETQGQGLLKEPPSSDFRTRKVFVVESQAVFWGAGTTLSPRGRDFLETLASFARRMPGRIVISEDGPAHPGTEKGDPDSSWELGVSRALAALNYLTDQGVSPDRCSIATTGMVPEPRAAGERRLEIVLLDARVYQ